MQTPAPRRPPFPTQALRRAMGALLMAMGAAAVVYGFFYAPSPTEVGMRLFARGPTLQTGPFFLAAGVGALVLGYFMR